MSKNYHSKRVNVPHLNPKSHAYSQQDLPFSKFHKVPQVLERNGESSQNQKIRLTQPSNPFSNDPPLLLRDSSSNLLVTGNKMDLSVAEQDVIEELSSDSEESKDDEDPPKSNNSFESTQVERMKTHIKKALKDTEFKKFLKKTLLSKDGDNSQPKPNQLKEAGASQTTTRTLATDEERKDDPSQISFQDNQFKASYNASKISTHENQNLKTRSKSSQEYETSFSKTAPPPIPSQTTPQFGNQDSKRRNLSESKQVRQFNEKVEWSSDEEPSITLSRFYYDQEKDSLIKCTDFEKFRGKEKESEKMLMTAQDHYKAVLPLCQLYFQYEQSDESCFECPLYSEESTWGDQLPHRPHQKDGSDSESDDGPNDDDDWYTDEELEQQTSRQTFRSLYNEVKRREKNY